MVVLDIVSKATDLGSTGQGSWEQNQHSNMEICGPLNIFGTVKDVHFVFAIHISCTKY